MNNFTTVTGVCPICQAPVSIISDHGDGKDYSIDRRPFPPLVALYLHGIEKTCKNCENTITYQADFLGGMYLIAKGDFK